MEELGTPFVCTVNADGSPDFTLMPDPPKGADRNFAPAGRLIDPEKADQMVKDSVDRGTPTREIATASRYLMLAAVSICTDSMNAFEHYLDASEEYQRDNAEYMVLDGRKAAAQIQSILGVMSELEGLEEHE
jgi:hypothetical protein